MPACPLESRSRCLRISGASHGSFCSARLTQQQDLVRVLSGTVGQHLGSGTLGCLARLYSSLLVLCPALSTCKVTVHHLASDDYVRQEATFWLENLRPDVQIYVEHSNEVWNPLFPQGRYATEKALCCVEQIGSGSQCMSERVVGR